MTRLHLDDWGILEPWELLTMNNKAVKSRKRTNRMTWYRIAQSQFHRAAHVV